MNATRKRIDRHARAAERAKAERERLVRDTERAGITPHLVDAALVVIESAHDPAAPHRPIRRARRIWAPDVLLRAGTIPEPLYRAAVRYLDDFQIAEGGSGARSDVMVDRPTSPGGVSDRRLDAQTRYRRATQAVGLVQQPVLAWCVLSHGSVTGYAENRGWPVDRATGYLLAALDRLAEHYGL